MIEWPLSKMPAHRLYKIWTFKSYYAASMWITFMAHGAAFAIFYPTWHDLTHLLNSTDEAMGWAKALSTFAGSAGVLPCGWLYTRFPRDVLMVLEMACMALLLMAIPHCGTYTLFMVCIGTVSFFSRAIDLACNVTAFSLFSASAMGPVLQSLHLVWSSGAFMSQAWAEPF